jgi:Trypsin-like peptidase domain
VNSRRALAAALLLAACALAPVRATSFLSGPELAVRLRQNLAYIEADDVEADEHGYGVVVGGDAETLWLVTARHVVVKLPMRGLGGAEQPSQRIRVRLCGAPEAGFVAAVPMPGFEVEGADIALLRVARPRGYALTTPVLGATPTSDTPVWLLGSENDCNPLPGEGRVRASADAAHNLRVDFPAGAVQGGSSGGAVLSGFGIVGLMKSNESPTSTVHAIDDLKRRVLATPGARWELADADNIPPGDPLAARDDLNATLAAYQLAVHDIHRLLQSSYIPRPTMTAAVDRYNAAVTHFSKMRNAHDGTLAASYPPAVLPAWAALADQLWALHQSFWSLEPKLLKTVFTDQRTNPEMNAHMQKLAPALLRLDTDLARFTGLLAKEP